MRAIVSRAGFRGPGGAHVLHTFMMGAPREWPWGLAEILLLF